VLAEGWEGAQIYTVCLEVNQRYPQFEKENEPIEKGAKEYLAQMGISVVDADAPCDATLLIDLEGEAKSDDYTGDDNKKMTCYSGARYKGEMQLISSEYPALVVTALGSYTPLMISDCAEEPAPNASFDEAWGEALVTGFKRLWGVHALLPGLMSENKDIQLQAANEIETLARKGEVGREVVPALAYAVENGSWQVSQVAASALAEIGGDAIEAVPAILRAWEKHESNPAASIFNFALVRISLAHGHPDCDNDPACWQAWWEAR
jgi:hypothetical protein